MSKSGRTMDNHTKGYQKVESKNSTISYSKTESGFRATVTSGGNEYQSRSFNSKDEARQEASTLATESLGFLYENNN